MIIIASILAVIGSPVAALIALEIRSRREEADQIRWANEQFARISEYLDMATLEAKNA